MLASVLSLAVLALLSVQSFASQMEPRVLFHAGNRKYLEEDIRAGNIPQNVWDNVIFGKTNFDLPEHRKGLYGATTIASTSLYSLYKVLEGQMPWVMVIRVKEECLDSASVYWPEYTLEATDRFSAWYSLHRNEYQSLEKECLEDRGKGSAPGWRSSDFYEINQQSPENQRLSRLCGNVLAKFLDDSKIKVVGDPVNDQSWYIRDRSCINSVTGTADDLFDWITRNEIGNPEEDPLTNLFGNSYQSGTFFGGNTFLFLNVLASTSRLDKTHRDAMNELLRELTRWIGHAKLPSKLSISQNDGNYFILREAIRATRGAIQKNRVRPFQSGLRARLEHFIRAHGENCHASHGVPKEFSDRCEATSLQQTRKLIRFLKKYQ